MRKILIARSGMPGSPQTDAESGSGQVPERSKRQRAAESGRPSQLSVRLQFA
jgi:hypothetical protein